MRGFLTRNASRGWKWRRPSGIWRRRAVRLIVPHGRLEHASQLLDMSQTGYEKGATSYLELLNAQHVYLSEQSDYTRALADYDIALAALSRAVGGVLK